MISETATALDPAGAAAVPPPSTAAPRPPLVRNRAILTIPESDLMELVDLDGGRRRIVGIRMEPMSMSAEILVEGDDLPEVAEGCYPKRLDLGRLRYRAPQIVEHLDITGWEPARIHNEILDALHRLIEHAGHLIGAATADAKPDLSVNARTTWIGAMQIVQRHAPLEMGSEGTLWCSSPACQHSEAPYWPCADYVAATLGVVGYLEAADND